MTIVKGGNRYFFCTPPYILDTITPYTGVKTADLASPNGTGRNGVNLSNFRGMALVPPEAYSANVWCHLFRGIASPSNPPDNGGNTDVTIGISLPTVNGESLKSFATLAVTTQSSGQPYPPGSLVETNGEEIEFPVITETNGNYARWTWSSGGNTVLGSAAMLRVTSFEVPVGYTLPATWPEKNISHASLAMYFGPDGYADSSPSARTVTSHNSSVQPGSTIAWAMQGLPLYQDAGGYALFNGVNSYLSFDGHDIVLSGDFTIELVIAASTNALQNGSQQRIISLGESGSLAIGIDQVGGGAIVLNESVSIIKTGGNSLVSGYVTGIKLSRESGVMSLYINGQRDGQPWTNNTAWTVSSTAEIGRLCGNNMGYFAGNIYFIGITNGHAV